MQKPEKNPVHNKKERKYVFLNSSGNEKSASPFSAMAPHFMKEQEDEGEGLVYQISNDPKAKWQ